MPLKPESPFSVKAFLTAAIEIAFIIFLFYANLLMGEFNRSNGHGKSFLFALKDTVTVTNFAIAVVAAIIGHAAFEFLRKRL
jgi:hypothetical protein